MHLLPIIIIFLEKKNNLDKSNSFLPGLGSHLGSNEA